MQIVPINLPEKYSAEIQISNDLRKNLSRSKAIRIKLHKFLIKELKVHKDLSEHSFKMLIRRGGIKN